MSDEDIRDAWIDPFTYYCGANGVNVASYPGVTDIFVLPPIAGGAPGLFDELTQSFEWVKANTLDPAYNFLQGKISAVARDVWAVVESVFMRATWFMYDYLRSLLLPLVADPNQGRFPPASEFRGLGFHVYFGTVFQMLFYALWNIGNAISGWLWDRVIDARNWLYDAILYGEWWLRDRIVDAAIQTWGKVTDAAGWVRDRVVDARNWLYDAILYGEWWLRDRVNDAAGWVRDRVNDAAGWLRDRVVDARDFLATLITSSRDFVVDQLFGAVVAGGQAIIEGLLEIFRQLFDTLLKGLTAAGDAIIDGVKAVFTAPVDIITDTVEGKLAIPLKLIRGEYASLDEIFQDALDPPGEIYKGIGGLILLPFVISSIIIGYSTGLSRPYVEQVVQEINRVVHPTILTLSAVQEAWNRNLLTDDQATDNLLRLGYGLESLTAAQELRFNIPSASDLVRFGVREVFTPAIAEEFGQFNEFPPAFGEAMTLLGYPAGGGDPATGSAAPGGRSWAEAYWGAHWELPSITQAFEMYHRIDEVTGESIIDIETLNRLLRAQDVMPFWRDKLVKIAYNPLTRVDVRRMYKQGVLELPDVRTAYLNLGYSPENADNLTEFVRRLSDTTDSDALEELADLSTSVIRQAYRRKVISREDALDTMVEGGVSAEVAEFLLSIDDAQLAVHPFGDTAAPVRDLTTAVIRQAYRERVYTRDEAMRELELLGYLGNESDVMLSLDDLQLTRDLKTAAVALVRERYIGFSIDAAGARSQLSAQGIHPDIQDLLLAEWNVDAERGSRRLSVAEVFRARTAGIFNDDAAFAYLLRLGYNEADANVLFELRTAA